MFLDRLTGLAFIALGFFVGWQRSRHLLAQSFFRVNVVTGLSVLLLQTESPWAVQSLRSFHAIAFLVTHSLVPAFLADFVFIYTHDHAPSAQLKVIPVADFHPICTHRMCLSCVL